MIILNEVLFDLIGQNLWSKLQTMPPTIGSHSQLESATSPRHSDDQELVFPIILEFLKQKGLSKTVSILSEELKECAAKNENLPVTKLEELFRTLHQSNSTVESSHQQDVKPQPSEESTSSDKQHVNFEDLTKGLEQLHVEKPDPKHKAKQFQKKKALSFTDNDVEFVDNRPQSDEEDVPQRSGLSFTDLLRLEKASKAAQINGNTNEDDPELSDKLYGTSYESLESAASYSREMSAPVSASSSRSQSISRSSILRSRSESIGSTRSSKSVSFVTTSDDSASGSGSDSEHDKNGKIRRTRARRKHKRRHAIGKAKLSDDSESSSDEDSDIKKLPAEDFFYSSEEPEDLFLFEDARETHSHSSEDDLVEEDDEGNAIHRGSPPPSDSEEETQWDTPSDEDEIPKEVQPNNVQTSEPLNLDNNIQQENDNEEDSALDEIVRDHIQLQRDEYYQELDTKQQPQSLRSSQSIHDSTHANINHDLRHYEDDLTEVSPDVPPAKDNVKYDSFELPIIYVRNRTGLEESKDFPIIVNSVVAGRYLVLSYIGSAAFSKAVKCKDLQSGQQVCIKIIKNNKEFFDQSLDEIKLLKYINSKADPDSHHVLRLYDYFYHKEHLFIVSELLQDNLYVFYKQNRESGEELYFTLDRLKIIAKQILEGLEFIHGLNLIHCDLKPENVLIKSFARCEVKIIDFGSSCFTADDLSSYVQSRSYRAPEVILGLPYNQKIDVWSLGCILAELWCGKVLFHNDSIPTLLARMIGILGNFDKDMLGKAHASKYFAKNGMLYERAPGKSGFNYIRPKKIIFTSQTQVRQSTICGFCVFFVDTSLRKETNCK